MSEDAKHDCPRCGELTRGSWSEGGLKWAICDECMAKERERAEQTMWPSACPLACPATILAAREAEA